IGCTTKKTDNSKTLIGLLALNSLKAPSTRDASVNVVAEPTAAGGSVTAKFKQSTINTTAYLAYMTFTPTANRFFILDFTNSNVSKASFSTVLTNTNCSDSSFTSVASLFNIYVAGDSLPSPYTSNSLSATDTKKIIYQTISSNSSMYTASVSVSNSSTPTGITVTRASFGN
ncbi:MAG TPA: hypothetical protein PL163_11425, partial [Leptospiraceae bacterium]|nr:hypothetical protein [Leptospiraceae bacterium]